MTNPIFDYGHADGCSSITGGAFVPNGIWPASYDGTYLFSDYVCGRLFQLVPKAGGGFDRIVFADGLGASSAVHMTFGPNGRRRCTTRPSPAAVPFGASASPPATVRQLLISPRRRPRAPARQ